MTLNGWLQIGLVLGLVLITARPLGLYMAAVFEGRRTFLTPVLAPVEHGFYWLSGVKADKEQGWLAYTIAMLVFSAFGFASLYGILRLQAYLPLNPQGFDNVAPDLAFNTAISFLTNTNWQAYGGETTMSHFSQMAGLAVHNFLSAATGIALERRGETLSVEEFAALAQAIESGRNQQFALPETQTQDHRYSHRAERTVEAVEHGHFAASTIPL